jgi:hypothetical protein
LKLDFAKASGAHDDEAGYVDGEEELEEIAKQDWQRVEPVLKRMAAGPQSRTATLALTLLYRHLVHTGNVTAVADIRERLRKTAEDQKALGYCRAKATESLLSSPWDGRDEWYLSLFQDDKYPLLARWLSVTYAPAIPSCQEPRTLDSDYGEAPGQHRSCCP